MRKVQFRCPLSSPELAIFVRRMREERRGIVSKGKDRFLAGFACAVAFVVGVDGSATRTDEALTYAGLTSVKDLRKAGVDDCDIETLRENIRELQERRRMRKKMEERDARNS